MHDSRGFREKIEQERLDSINEVQAILDRVDFDMDELEDVESPRILVLGTGPYNPEAHIVKDWADRRGKPVTVTCVDKEDNDELFNRTFLKLEETENFKMERYRGLFEDFPFEEYDLIFLLRFPTLSKIPDSVYESIASSLRPGGMLLLSGGYSEKYFTGYSLKQPGINLESMETIPRFTGDFWGSYSGDNVIFKFKNRINEI